MSIRCNWVILLIILSMLFCQLWQPIPAWAVVFSDLEGHWGKADIEKMSSQKIIAGYPDGQFRPDQTISRAELAVLISRSMLVYPVNSNSSSYHRFTDVTAADWFYSDVMKLAIAGIAQGPGNGQFEPQKLVQRQEAAQMLHTWMELEGWAPELKDDEALLFSDEQSISGWAQKAVQALTWQKVFCGYPDLSFRPQQSLTRVEACIILRRVTFILENQNNFLPVLQSAVPPVVPSRGEGSAGGSWAPDNPANEPAGLMSNQLQCQVRVIN